MKQILNYLNFNALYMGGKGGGLGHIPNLWFLLKPCNHKHKGWMLHHLARKVLSIKQWSDAMHHVTRS
jgi:hypothetical protein